MNYNTRENKDRSKNNVYVGFSLVNGWPKLTKEKLNNIDSFKDNKLWKNRYKSKTKKMR